ncbi:MAG: ATP synthase subunit I [Rubrivivax sp.]|jgi:F1F0 ATPase subunit 2|nr:ATP synthase subunit I [Rubrivivax sp.]MBK8526249.1 ATP synthase subunit I [Rubrivivax sp.]
MTMTSDEWSGALLAALGGVALGGFFFGGLWWTLQRTLRSAHVVSWQLASLLVRNAVALGGFWLLCGASWQRWLFCLSGFMVTRMWVLRLTRRSGTMLEVPHAAQP